MHSPIPYPLGTLVHNIELRPDRAVSWLVVQALAQLTSREGNIVLKLPSGESRMVLTTCKATIGTLETLDHSLVHFRQSRPFKMVRQKTPLAVLR